MGDICIDGMIIKLEKNRMWITFCCYKIASDGELWAS
jgi:hypothetical protein